MEHRGQVTSMSRPSKGKAWGRRDLCAAVEGITRRGRSAFGELCDKKIPVPGLLFDAVGNGNECIDKQINDTQHMMYNARYGTGCLRTLLTRTTRIG